MLKNEISAKRFRALLTAWMLWASVIASAASTIDARVTVEADKPGPRIDPNIYGVAHATSAQLADLNAPLNRNGGNNTSRYNWQINADNRGQDWYFQSIPAPRATAGQRGDDFVLGSRAGGAEPMMTIPISEPTRLRWSTTPP